jgi:aspartyl-tRNA(Asn)/glutamyl-tRNA(Gln) amidotransferase subunit A
MKTFSSRERVEQALTRIADPKGEGAKACLTVYADAARAAADAADARAKAGISLGPLDGMILSIKDLFDVAAEPTRAGSKVLADEAKPAAADAPVVRRLRAGGAVIVGKTNMTEFALGAIGANPHFGTPANPRDRARVPGGSSSGAAVTVGDGMAEIAIGSDTGGSVRIPAALCGIVGFKPSRQRVPTAGAFPLSTTLDSIGPLANSVADCAEADAVMAGEDFAPLSPLPLAGLRFGIAQGFPLENLDDTVAAAFDAATERLAKAGVRLTPEPMPLFDEMRQVNAYGGIVQPEAYAIHQDRVKRRAADIDPNIRVRLERGGAISAADYINMLYARASRARHGPAALRPRCADHADSRDRSAEDRRRGRSGRFRQEQHDAAAQYVGRELLRSLRSLAAAAGEASGRADAACAQWHGPDVAARRGGRGGFVREVGMASSLDLVQP